jgi:signal transduction histidine kinase
LVPTAGVLWFLNEAVQNERLAGKQRLAEAYRSYLPSLRVRLDAHWRRQAEALDTAATGLAGGPAFAACVHSGLADSVLCYDPPNHLSYPTTGQGMRQGQGVGQENSPFPQAGAGPGVRAADATTDSALAKPPVETANEDAWLNANRLEFTQQDPLAAAAAYSEIASQSADAASAARAYQAQARCLAKAGRTDDAVEILLGTLGRPPFARVQDPAGRLIVADAQLRAIELLRDRKRSEFDKAVGGLAARLNDYADDLLPATQRRFLMRELIRLTGGQAAFPTLEAEGLAADFLEAEAAASEKKPRANGAAEAGVFSGVETVFQKELGKVSTRVGFSNGSGDHADKPPVTSDGALRPSGMAGVWRLASTSGRVVGLFQTETVLKRVAEEMAAVALSGDTRVAVLLPGMEPDAGALYSLSAGSQMPGWRLTLTLIDADGTASIAGGRMVAYVWTASLLIAAMSIVAFLVAGVLQRQMRVARLKNDLLATVSHELKTPLTSMRLLVDTLLDAETLETPQTREYLQLVANENMRLSHLIDNFLSFSRMERGKRTFDLAECSSAEIVRRAVDAAGERFQTPECRLQVETAAELPPVMADADALVTAVLNLLDNAYKYSGGAKEILLRADAQNGQVRFAVSDRGIGLSLRAAKKVFRPFYQVDQHLSRSVGGCGLGLSIVQFIVAAHGGSVQVDSRPGKGSTFTIVLPCCGRGSLE